MLGWEKERSQGDAKSSGLRDWKNGFSTSWAGKRCGRLVGVRSQLSLGYAETSAVHLSGDPEQQLDAHMWSERG